ncbi:hypothetical protein IQ07DRAFT_636334 [Pyrenochaeta sp. DS3sAY3a]|nr:hypothetical protein IQ07DRAFT_636334 [Pyrenochaeta sp. DS3sAY3a]
MASKYSVFDHDPEEERKKDPQGPPLGNLFAAARYLNLLFSANGVRWAAMGGFAMICRGSRRTTRDVDIVTDTIPKTLWTIIEAQPRLIIPNTRLLDGVIKIFVLTGPSYQDRECIIDRPVEADLVIPGAKGTPVLLAPHIVTLHVTVGGQTQGFYCLNTLYMMRTKLRHCATRTMDRDVIDLKFMLDTFRDEVVAIRNQLDDGDIEAFLDRDYIKELGDAWRTYYRSLLCG